MYAGTDKYGGGVVGEDFKDAEAAAPNLEDILDTASAEETVVTSVPYSYLDEDTNEVVEGTSSVVLSSRLNPEYGGLMWVEEEDSAETYKNVVSMSQMTSMLRDLDRNAAYEHGIRRGIEQFMATHNRRPITMAGIAQDVIDANGFADTITVFPLRSTDLRVPTHLPVRADMMVSELFDSLLLGEGLLPTLAHARAHLLAPDAIVIPQHATVYAKLVASDTLFRMNSFDQVHVDKFALARSAEAWKCTGGGRVALPLHIENDYVENRVDLTPVVPVLSFDFGQNDSAAIATSSKKNVTGVTAQASGRIDAIVMWWSVDFGDGVAYSTESGAQNWQDHWVPVVFPLTAQQHVAKGDAVELTAHSDSLRVWFDVSNKTAESPSNKRAKVDDDAMVPSCTCGLHLICNAERVSMLTNMARTEAYADALRAIVAGLHAAPDNQKSCLDVSDGSLVALLAAALPDVANITSIESKEVSALIFQQIATRHNLDDRLTILGCGVKGLLVEHLHGEAPVDILVGEPFYYAMQNLPTWQALNFWYRRSAVSHLLSARAVVLPYRGFIRAMGVRFDHLHECFGTVEHVSGFDHAPFDALQGGYLARDFPFPTYMYSYTAGTPVFDVMPLNFMEPIARFDASIRVPVTSAVNAVIVWVDYQLDMAGHYHVSTGPSVVHAKQAVRFLPRSNASTHASSSSFQQRAVEMTAGVAFDASEGVLSYTFDVEHVRS
ncbi:hypothetical protein DYB32_002715 [Aphanomyces invadans]|uniref:Protein arginine N-methyltransferase domain-containing protein n=1 Tax=Aphanomyces invadans TaxID=157072 RepID=A0A418B2J0_9STRA|nr:hypothetical protein DYB32_002715 [Aphanomyces invadans]